MSKYMIKKDLYTQEGLQAIKETKLLSKENFEKIDALSKVLIETWNNTQIWRSETEMRTSVLNDTKFPTRGLKYLQARREQEVFFTNLMYLATDYEEKQGELLELQGHLEELDEENDKVQKGKEIQLKAKIKRCEWNLVEMQKAGHHRVREVTTWEKIKKELDDGSFDVNNYDEIQQEGYNIRWQRELESEQASGNATGNRVGVLRGSLSALTNLLKR